MKIWLSKNSEISVREQIVTQITLGIVSGDLPVGERLPSTREMARRFQIHANTVGAAYQKLSEKNLIEFKKGSGFYVCAWTETVDADGEIKLDALIAEFFRAAQACGFSRDEIHARLKKRLENPLPERILVVEPNEDFREILIEEIRAATHFPVQGTSFERLKRENQNAIIVAMSDEKQKLETLLTAETRRVYLISRSVSGSMEGEARPRADDLIAVVSGWENFLVLAKTVLVAANVEADSIVVRSTKTEIDKRKGLQDVRMIICDTLAAKEFGGDGRVRVFRLIADASLAEIKEHVGVNNN